MTINEALVYEREAGVSVTDVAGPVEELDEAMRKSADTAGLHVVLSQAANASLAEESGVSFWSSARIVLPKRGVVTSELAVDIEGLLAKLQLKTDEALLKSNEDRLSTSLRALKSRTDGVMEAVEKNIKAQRDAYKQAKIKKAFMWLGFALAVVLCVAASIVTAGAAALAALTGVAALSGVAGGAATIAVGAGVGAAALATTEILAETGKLEDFTNWLSEKLFQGVFGMSKEDADLAAGIAVAAMIITTTLLASILGGNAAGAAVSGGKAVVDAVALGGGASKALAIGTAAMGVAQAGVQVMASIADYKAGMAAVKFQEVHASMQQLNKIVEEIQEELEQNLQQLQETLRKSLDIVLSKLDVETEIARMIGAVA